MRPALDAKLAAPAFERREADAKLLGCFVYRAAAVEDSQLLNAQVVAGLSSTVRQLSDAREQPFLFLPFAASACPGSGECAGAEGGSLCH